MANKRTRSKKRSSKKKRILKKGLLIYVLDFFKFIINNIRNFIFSDAIKSKKSKLTLTYSIIIFVLTLFTYNITKKNAYEVLINDTFVCYTELSKTLTDESLKTSAIAKLESDNGTTISTEDVIKLKKVNVNKKKGTIKNLEDASQDVVSKLNYSINATQIEVDGLVLTTLKNEVDANTVLDKVKNLYAKEEGENITAEFLETVNTPKIIKSLSEVDSIDRAFEILTSKNESEMTHTVSKNETLSSIARKYNMSREDIVKLNSDINPDRIKIGQEINVMSSKPVLSVSISYDIVDTKVLEFTTEKKENPMQNKNYKNILQAGENGEVLVTTKFTKLNDVVVSEEEVSSVIKKESIPEIVEVGTK